MRIDLGDLPVDTSLLHHLLRDMAAVVESHDVPIKHLPAPSGAYQRCPPFRGRVNLPIIVFVDTAHLALFKHKNSASTWGNDMGQIDVPRQTFAERNVFR
ncbi:MAG: hypothetical protein L0Y60_07510 [Beijerinckiaceae bacterium]|nr:hypothetical protein [Beijerinckiaceae bacterium]